MDDPVEINRRIERLAKRVGRRDDYGTLLASGQVIYSVEEVDDPDAWRAGIKRQARADCIKVRTGVTGTTLWALLAGPLPEAQRAEDVRYFHLFHRLKSQAEFCGHALKVAFRDGEEALFNCERCDAVGYADAASGPLIGGSLFEKACSGRGLPDAPGTG